MTMSLISDVLGAGINEEKQRDPEAHSVKKGNQWYFGYKEHIGVDADSGLVHMVETTAAILYEYSARDCAARPLKLSIHSGGIEHACRRR